MQRDWIIDVLADLKAFAEHNGMAATAAGLEDATLVAVAELASPPHLNRVIEADVVPAEIGREAGNVTQLFSHRGRP